MSYGEDMYEDIGHRWGWGFVSYGGDMLWRRIRYEGCSIEYLRDLCKCMMSGGI